jgi:hypothetical protein
MADSFEYANRRSRNLFACFSEWNCLLKHVVEDKVEKQNEKTRKKT